METEVDLSPRQVFCIEQLEKTQWNPSIDIMTPMYVTCGKEVHIEKNVVFSNHGLGAEKFDHGWQLIPHTGKIKLGNYVTILDGAIIMRATKDLTQIKEGTIVGVRAHIGHNVTIGRKCLIGSAAVIGGSANIGDDTYIGAGAMISNKVKIGKNCIVGIGSVVIKDVPDNHVVAGNPARILKTNNI